MTDPRLARPLWRGRTNVDAYTIAWIEHAEAILADRRPDIAHQWDITKGSYQGLAGQNVSGTTHRLGGAVDFTECGHPECLLAGRLAGGFIWRRTPDQGPWGPHRHGGPLGHPFQDQMLHNQELAYLAGFNGLGHLGRGGLDDGPRLDPIPQPIWPWPPEDDMPLTDADAALVVKTLLDTEVDPGVTVRRALRRAARTDDELTVLVQAAVAAAGSTEAGIDGVYRITKEN